MTALDPAHFEVAGVRVTYVQGIVAVGVLLVGFALASAVSSRIRGKPDATAPWRATIAQVAGHAGRVVSVVAALQVAGVDIGTLLAASAVVAVGIGIAMQKVAENFVSGVILLAERSIREGDIVEFDGRVARVRTMGIRATVAVTLDEEELIVPNSLLAQAAVKNLTLTEAIYRLRVGVGVAYSSDLDEVEAVLLRAARALPARDPDREPVVLLVDFGASSVDFDVSVWTRDVWGHKRAQSDLRKLIWRALKAASIEIPFPQVDVHHHGRPPAPPPDEEHGAEP